MTNFTFNLPACGKQPPAISRTIAPIPCGRCDGGSRKQVADRSCGTTILSMAAFNGSALAVLSIGEKALNLMGQSHVNANRACYLNSYWNRGDLKENRLQRQRENVIALYDASIRWVDAQAASLVEKLRELKLWESCVFALTADHGEEFLEHGGRYHSPAKLTG